MELRRFLSDTKDVTLFNSRSHAPFGSPIFKIFKIILKYLVVFFSLICLKIRQSSVNSRTCDLTLDN